MCVTMDILTMAAELDHGDFDQSDLTRTAEVFIAGVGRVCGVVVGPRFGNSLETRVDRTAE